MAANSICRSLSRPWTSIALVIAALSMATLTPTCAWGVSITKVGNGDDGGDLEGGTLVSSGILLETRTKALARLKRFQVQTIDHLGTLLPELERSDIYLVPRDLEPKVKADKGMESSPDGKAVYARTFAEPHAATRFFPAALMLNEEQLISLHVHEALHRSLPPEVRENEEIVTKLTLALAAPDASRDRIRKTVAQTVPAALITAASAGSSHAPVTVIINNGSSDGRDSRYAHALDTEVPPLENPSTLTYSYRAFFRPDTKESVYPVESLHSLQSFLYPFGTGPRAFGMGVEFSYLQKSEQSMMGPLGLSARIRLLSIRGFDVGAFARVALESVSDKDLRNSPLGRDIHTLGLSLRRETSKYYIENYVSLSPGGEAKQKIGSIEYKHSYGALTSAAIRAGAKIKAIEAGGFAEVLLSDSYRISGGAFSNDTGRYRIVSVGPEVAYNWDAFRFGLSGRWVLDATPGVSLDTLGDIMGHGMGQGFVSTSAQMRF